MQKTPRGMKSPEREREIKRAHPQTPKCASVLLNILIKLKKEREREAALLGSKIKCNAIGEVFPALVQTWQMCHMLVSHLESSRWSLLVLQWGLMLEDAAWDL